MPDRKEAKCEGGQNEAGSDGRNEEHVKNKQQITYRQLLSFFLPLAVTPMMIGSTHTIINAALARLPYPDISLAVFTVVKSFSHIIRAPILMSRQVFISLVEDSESLQITRKIIWAMGFVIFAVLILLGYTPLGGWFLRNVIGIKGARQIAYGYYALKITCFLPLVELLRNNNQGIAIALKRTNLVIPGIILRLSVISIFLWWTVRSQAVLGVIAGSLSWVVGIGLEGLFIVLALSYYYGSPAQAAEKMPPSGHTNLDAAVVFKFFIPLGMMMVLTKFLQPLIQSGIARTASPTQSLAAYGVAWTLVFLLIGPLRMLNQCTLVFTEGINDPSWDRILKFGLMTGLVISGLVLLIAVTSPGFWLLHQVIAVSEPIAHIAQKTMLAMVLFPLIRSFRESYWGILMKHRYTGVIGVAKGANIIVVASSLLLGLLTLNIEAAVIGAMAFTMGEGIESLIIWRYAVKNSNRMSVAAFKEKSKGQ